MTSEALSVAVALDNHSVAVAPDNRSVAVASDNLWHAASKAYVIANARKALYRVVKMAHMFGEARKALSREPRMASLCAAAGMAYSCVAAEMTSIRVAAWMTHSEAVVFDLLKAVKATNHQGRAPNKIAPRWTLRKVDPEKKSEADNNVLIYYQTQNQLK